MQIWLLILALTTAQTNVRTGDGTDAGTSGEIVVERDDVTIRCRVEGSKYSWQVTNVDAPTITSFEVRQRFLYNGNVPSNWQIEYRDTGFFTWTERRRDGIRRGQSGTFSGQVGVQGAVLDQLPITLGVTGDGEPIVVEDVWGPSPLPRSQVMLVAGLLLGIGLFHARRTRVAAR